MHNMNRVGIFVFFDNQGVVDRSVVYYISKMMPFLSRLVIVANGILSDEGHKKFEEFTSEIIVRDNTGYDTGAFLAGLRHVGFDNLKEYDELVLFNDSVFGPVYPLQEMFGAMDKRTEIDFWGVTAHKMMRDVQLQHNPCGYMPAHIQSYFTVFRKTILSSKCFEDYWQQLPEMQDRTHAIQRHETYITYYLEKNGFTWTSYVPMAEKTWLDCILTSEPLRAITEFRCPFVKKTICTHKHYGTYQLYDIFSCLHQNTNYDISLITENIRHRLSDNELIDAVAMLPIHKTKEIRFASRLYYALSSIQQKKYRLKYAIISTLKGFIHCL